MRIRGWLTRLDPAVDGADHPSKRPTYGHASTVPRQLVAGGIPRLHSAPIRQSGDAQKGEVSEVAPASPYEHVHVNKSVEASRAMTSSHEMVAVCR
jgi:hypothetical protein